MNHFDLTRKQATALVAKAPSHSQVEATKVVVLAKLDDRPATAQMLCWRMGVTVNRDNMRLVRAALRSLVLNRAVDARFSGVQLGDITYTAKVHA